MIMPEVPPEIVLVKQSYPTLDKYKGRFSNLDDRLHILYCFVMSLQYILLVAGRQLCRYNFRGWPGGVSHPGLFATINNNNGQNRH